MRYVPMRLCLEQIDSPVVLKRETQAVGRANHSTNHE
jgi:hypothetical protein